MRALTLMVTATVFFVMNTFPVAAAIALTEEKSLRQIWRESYFWSFPYYLLGAGMAGAASAINRYVGWAWALLAVPVVYLIYRSYYLYLGRVEDDKKHAEEMASLHLRTIEALALAIEAKDHTTHDHLQRVQVYAIEVGKDWAWMKGNWKPCARPRCCTTSASWRFPNTSFRSPAS